jgi:hypothetical protein
MPLCSCLRCRKLGYAKLSLALALLGALAIPSAVTAGPGDFGRHANGYHGFGAVPPAGTAIMVEACAGVATGTAVTGGTPRDEGGLVGAVDSGRIWSCWRCALKFESHPAISLVSRRVVLDGESGAHQSSGLAIISHMIVITAPNAGKPKANHHQKNR